MISHEEATTVFSKKVREQGTADFSFRHRIAPATLYKMLSGNMKLSVPAALAVGLNPINLLVYLSDGELLPPEFEPYVTERPLLGRPRGS